jgi:hypothetical protein
MNETPSNTDWVSTSTSENTQIPVSVTPADIQVVSPEESPSVTPVEIPVAPENSTNAVSSLESSIQNAADTALTEAQNQVSGAQNQISATSSGPGTGVNGIDYTRATTSTQSPASPYSQVSSETGDMAMSAGLAIVSAIYGAIVILYLISQYVLSRKLRLPYPWLGLIPVLNIYNLVKIAGHHGWKVLLLLFPLVNLFYIAFSLNPAISRRTGHGILVSIGLFFLSPIVFPIIAFTYKESLTPSSGGETVTPATL